MTVTELRRMLERAERNGLGGLPVRVELPADLGPGVRWIYPRTLTTVQQRTFENLPPRCREIYPNISNHATLKMAL